MSGRCKRGIWVGQHHQSGNPLKVDTKRKPSGGKVVVLYEKKGIRFRQLCELSLNTKNAYSYMERLGQEYQKGEIDAEALAERCRQHSNGGRKRRVDSSRGPSRCHAADEPATRSAGAVSVMGEFDGKLELSNDPIVSTIQETRIDDLSPACDLTPAPMNDFRKLAGLITDPPVYCGGIYDDLVDSE